MKRPLLSWLCLCGVLSLPLSSWAKAPPPVKAVKLTEKELESLERSEALWKRCEQPRLAENQNFRLQQPGSPLDGRALVAVLCLDMGVGVRFGLFKDGKLEQLLPEHPASAWNADEVQAVSFSDVDGDGRSDLVTIVSAMSGVGPTAAEPFNVGAVWFQTPEGQFVSDPQAEAVLEKVREPTVKKVLAALKKARVRQK